MNFWWVFVGGGLGSIARYVMYVQFSNHTHIYFLGTWAANFLACMLLGFLMAYPVSGKAQLLLATGFCGGFSTFSTFSYEAIQLYHHGEWRTALLYVLMSILAGWVGLWIGTVTAQHI